MELWIRSQDKKKLIKVENIMIIEDAIREMTVDDILGETIQPPIKSEKMIISSDLVVGKYKSEERALEVLDEIQSKLKVVYLMKLKVAYLMKLKDDNYNNLIVKGKRYLEELNDIKIVTGDKFFDLEPINSDVYVYEMPKE